MSLPENAIAIVGMSGRFPGAADVAQFWRNLRDGVTSITRFTDAELEDSFPPDIRSSPNFVAARPILPDVDRFDAEFFGMLPREAALIDPQARLLLECAWSAMEDAGYDPSRAPGAVGVFAGSSMNTYLLRNVLAERLDTGRFVSDYQVGSYDALLGALPDTLATRISYKLNLRGPAMTVQSACSTSLLAVAQACQSLLLYQSDMALAGGVSITFPQKRGYQHLEGGMVSPDGVCRPFDSEGAGTMFGDGVAMVVLKRLADAVEDRDHIYAVIRGSAVNNDGSDKVGVTAPSVRGQAEVIASALAASDVEPGSIGYVECHGTATPLGDPIEFAGLVRGFGSTPVAQPTTALGSAKANVGHLDVVAGVAGLIKTALMLEHREIPALTNFRKPNPHIDLAGSPFYFPTRLAPWPAGATPRRAGVSSFGVGGTNVHVVLEEAPALPASDGSTTRRHVLPLSARTDAALSAAAAALADHLAAHPETAIVDTAFTLQRGRRTFERRAAVACATREEAIAALRALPPTAPVADIKTPLVFMFPGQGAQYPGMACVPYRDHAVFRAVVDEGIALATPIVGGDLRALLLDPKAPPGTATQVVQPALFIFEYALARLWISWGLKPDAMIGHSVGELVAACVAGVYSFADGCRFVATRARIMQGMVPGAMLAVRLPEAELKAELGSALDLAAVNAPSISVAAGPPQEIAALNERLTARGVACRLLAVSHAFHSRALDPVLAEIEAAAAGVQLAAPAIPFASCVTGGWTDGAQATDPRYWASHGRAAVRFADALATVTRDSEPFLLEIGPGRTLSTLAPQIVDRKKLRGTAASLPEAETDDLCDPLAALWRAGFTPDWAEAAATTDGRRIPLPTYRFQRARYWIEPTQRPALPPQEIPAEFPSALREPPHIPMPEAPPPSPVPTATGTSRLATLQGGIVAILQELSGASDIDPEANFLALGFDSLLLGQVARAVEKKFRTKVTFRQLLKEFSSVALLARHLDTTLPKEQVTAPAPAMPATPQIAAAVPAAGAPASDALSALVQTQLQAMNALFAQQLQAFQGQAPAAATPPAATRAPTPTLTPLPVPAEDGEARVRLYKPSAAANASTLSNAQRDYVEGLVKQLDARMPLSKSRTQQDRAVLADPRTVAGFRQEWKELVYPVLAARAKGSKIQDIDGNDYVDLVNGYGQTMLGHSPDFVTAAVAAQLEEGFPIGPQTPLAGEVAAMVAAMTGDERVTFCNTGSEAVMAAMRVARAVTGRERVVVFNNDYHGQFDEVLVKAGGGTAPRALPVAPGIPPESVANMTVLRYGDPQSLAWIEANAEEIAAVLVEPVQSRHPALRPEAFLRKLRAVTEASGTALVFDEIVTGFRVHPGGMQSVFGIRADLATYGKVVGGGMPIGILAGKARFMDALDGGMWRYGDDSAPEIAPTFFAGTFVRHPLVLAAAKAVLLHLAAEGPALQERLSARMGGLVERLNRELERRGLATRAEGYSSWFYLSFAAESPLASLFWPHMRLLGVHVQEGYPCFLTTAHSDADIDTIERAFRTTLDALESAGILVGSAAASPSTVAESAPLTEPQLEILTAAQMSDEASSAFNESVSIAFDGPLDQGALSGALNAVIARHQALRGRVGRDDERMHFAPSLVLPLELRDFASERDPDAARAAFLAADARTPFDLWAGPLVRATLVRLAADRHVLVFTAHHIVCDGWSVNIILGDLATFYRTAHAAEPPALPPAPRFSDYAAAQAQSKEAQSADLAYWTQLYADVPPLPELPTDRPRPAQRSYAGATWSTQFDAGLLAGLKKTGAAHGATLFSMLFTALQVVLGRLSGSSDIVMGVPVAGQSVDDEPDLVGHCVEMLPLRAPLAWDAPFGAHVQAVAQRLLDSFDHPQCTYGTLVRALHVRRSANRLPLTEIQFNLERMADGLDFGGPTVTVVPNAKAAVNFDLFVNVIESAAGLRIDCDYNSDLYDEATIARWLAHYRRLLDGIVAAPATAVASLPILSAEQERFVLDTVNDSAAAYPGDRCIHELFSAQAARTPDAIAVVDATGSMTYAELDRRSTRLAREILGIHTVRGGRVAVAVDRSRALPLALLGVMKAGHAYVPLDVTQPLERLRQIAVAAQIDGIVCQDERIRSIAPYAFGLRLDQFNFDDGLAMRPPPRMSSEESAYILFTSGSTGAPKGVEVGHRALTNIISDIARRLDVGAADVVMGSSAITFDVAATELYTPLIVGARLVLSQAEEVKSGFELVALARKSGATLMQATPTLWRMLLEAGFASWSGLKMITVGEAISRDVVDRLIAGGGRLWNLYGPTETTLYSSGREMLPGETGVTIGTPLANNRLYVLDARDRLAPPGALGRLFIGGDGLAKGYFDRSDLTGQAFRSISLAGRAPQRLYWTGDLARLLPSGEFELHGRVDHQVKLRGFRIELEEIENVLRTAPGLRDCAVLLRSDAGPDPALVAYVVVDDPKPAALTAHLASRLPDYMVPARWIRLETLPMTPNGKVDRNALPPPAASVPEKIAPADHPKTPLEARISSVWASVIGLPEVGVDAPLFDLGADSLQVFRIAAHLDRDGIAVSARDLMKNPTVAALARGLEGGPETPPAPAPAKKGPSLADFRRGARRPILTP